MPASVAASRPQRLTSVMRTLAPVRPKLFCRSNWACKATCPASCAFWRRPPGEVHDRFVDAGQRDLDAEVAQLRADAWPFAEKIWRRGEIIRRQRGEDRERRGTARRKGLKPARRAPPELASRPGFAGMAPTRLRAVRRRRAPQTRPRRIIMEPAAPRTSIPFLHPRRRRRSPGSLSFGAETELLKNGRFSSARRSRPTALGH